MKSSRPASRSRAIGALALAVLLAGCAVGPDFVRPAPDAPEDWQAWRSADPVLVQAGVEAGLPRGAWWLAYGDPTLDALQQRARDASPDLQAAVLHLAQARVQRGTVASRQLPEVGLDAGVSRQRQSEYGASIRLLDAIGGANRDALVEVLSQPFNLYQAGLGVSWDLDLWGRVRRSIEAADADVERQADLEGLLAVAAIAMAKDAEESLIVADSQCLPVRRQRCVGTVIGRGEHFCDEVIVVGQGRCDRQAGRDEHGGSYSFHGKSPLRRRY